MIWGSRISRGQSGTRGWSLRRGVASEAELGGHTHSPATANHLPRPGTLAPFAWLQRVGGAESPGTWAVGFTDFPLP